MTKYKLHRHSPYNKLGAKKYVNDRTKKLLKIRKVQNNGKVFCR